MPQKFQIFLEILGGNCLATGNIGVISMFYQLPLSFLSCKCFHSYRFLEICKSMSWVIPVNEDWVTLDYSVPCVKS